MSSAPPGDPRLDADTRSERDVRPVVDKPRGGLSTAAVAGLAVILGLMLFGVLEARREAASAPAVRDRSGNLTAVAPPPLYLPPPPLDALPPTAPPPAPVAAAPRPPAVQLSQPPSTAPQVAYQASASVQPRPAPTPRTSGGAAVVVDASQAPTAANERSNNNPLAAPSSTDRARAGFLANKSTTVAQGTLIPAVLETGFDSTRPGFARALVQRDIRGFDGARILIPRGSRLIGEYAADTAQGQNRAMIAWSRLIRPDGVTIAIGSPVADPVGRGGVKAEVNSHFLARFAGAILQSALDVGVNLASRSSGSPTIVALPGSVQSGTLVQTPANIRPTLRVPPGTSVSVFVARDLDFTDTDGDR